MRTEAEMMQQIIDIARRRPEILAVGMNGSRTNRRAPKDQFQDYDIVYVVNDLAKLLADRSWLDEFGERLIMQTPEEMALFAPSLGKRFTFLMQFTDDTRIDLMLCPLSEVENWLKEDRLIEIIYDPSHILPAVPRATDKDYWVQKPTNREFSDCCNEFWWVSTYVVKGLFRKELAYARDHLYMHCYQELLRLFSWQIGEETHYSLSVGKNYKYLSRYLSEAENQALDNLLDLRTEDSCWRSLCNMEALFHQTAEKYAETSGLRYEGNQGQALMSYTHRWYDQAKARG
ncbi:aminoglycoside adenylyltransferase [Enterococcus sp. JM4C]|uniref:aminoglycoside 6-adenylyltransferase n=1 Tax=Candidatus Enterococcus huntleyi TaxID=1857217 RepID=UPI00137B10DE|nr:aminoglycoside 6-adenylyltransferase [Enterococcus sp. JM4C]KAF1296806.1 aminoglycoside adenylyltransferase [Enterococcus sp. JM4C]